MFRKARRRRFPRLTRHYLLKYRISGENKVLTFTRNINAGGVLFHSQEALPVGRTVELWFNFPFHPEPVKATAKILRVKPLKKIGGYDVAVEFIEIEEKYRYLINYSIKAVVAKEQGKTLSKKGEVHEENVGW